MKLQCPIPKILLPVDGSEHSKRAVQFAGCLGVSLGKSLSGLTLLHVMAKVKGKHIEEKIRPFLDEAEKTLIDLGIGVEIEKPIVYGDPAREIVRIADEGKFSTIIMARRGLSEIKGFLLGSITSKVVHSASRQIVYIVGHRILKDKACPVPKILIPVDGSIYSMRGVEDAACLAAGLKTSVSKITLFRVINLSVYLKRVKEGIEPEEEAKRILDEAKEVFRQSGIPEELITTKVSVGRKPAEEILKEAEEGYYNLIIMGRKGRSAIKDLILGGVSTTVLQHCQNPTVAIVSSE
ncbi:MAG: universal stress protein [Thermodesulfovibrionales bacterium]|nr:universal stress protein [Thermodesulfovibrionales bacterium]